MSAMKKTEAALLVAMSVVTVLSPAGAQTPQTPLPDVSVTAPRPSAPPNTVPHVVAPSEQNWYFGRNRVEEEMFAERPCSETRMSPTANSGKCLEGYKLTTGYVPSSNLRSDSVLCMVQLDVVISSTATYTFEADAFV
jgi:hypothetical protein